MGDATRQCRLIILRTLDASTCFGCGHGLPPGEAGAGRGTSRFSRSPAVHLCSNCCLVEAFRGDFFGVAGLVAEAARLGPIEPPARRRRSRSVP